MVKAQAWPLHQDAPGWRADAIDFRQQASRRYAPSMRQRIDIDPLYAGALRPLPKSMDGQPPLPIQSEVPTLDELLSEP